MARPKRRHVQLQSIDLFSGAGGLSLGFSNLGIEPVLAVEKDEWAAKSFKANFQTHVQDVEVSLVDDFPAADLVLGGPPCQGFSPLGRDRDDDSRAALNRLWLDHLRVVKRVRPLMFLVENVPQFLNSSQFVQFRRYCARYLKEYELDAQVLNAVNFGVPQSRKRGFIIGSRVGLPGWPTPTHQEGGILGSPWRTVRDAIGDLPLDPNEESMHWSRNSERISLLRYSLIPEGGNRFDLQRLRPDLLPPCWERKSTGTTDGMGRMWWDRPAPTIRTEFFKPEKGRYLHPEANRPITHREAARLQTFPDGFIFEGSRTQVARQIGNAVPPLLAEALAKQIALHLTFH